MRIGPRDIRLVPYRERKPAGLPCIAWRELKPLLVEVYYRGLGWGHRKEKKS